MKWATTNYNSTCDGDWMCIHVVCQFTRPTIRCHIRAFRLISWQSEAYRRESRRACRGVRRVWPIDIWRLVSLHRTLLSEANGTQLARYLGTDRFKRLVYAWWRALRATNTFSHSSDFRPEVDECRFLRVYNMSTAKCRKSAKFPSFMEMISANATMTADFHRLSNFLTVLQ